MTTEQSAAREQLYQRVRTAIQSQGYLIPVDASERLLQATASIVVYSSEPRYTLASASIFSSSATDALREASR